MTKKTNYLLFFVFVLITGITDLYSMEQEEDNGAMSVLYDNGTKGLKRKNNVVTALSDPSSKRRRSSEENETVTALQKIVESFGKKFGGLPVDVAQIIIDYKISIEKEQKEIRRRIENNIAFFTITCIHCSPNRQFTSHFKHNCVQVFKHHLANKHQNQNINKKQAKIYIIKNLQKPKPLVILSVHCPEPKCNHITHDCHRANDLESLQIFFVRTHI